MGGLTSFLFGGSAPKNVTTTGSTTTALPQFLQDYSQQLLARAAMQGMEGYQSYNGPRIAGFNQDQLNAFQGARNLPSSYQDVLDTSKTALTNAGRTLPEAIGDYMNPYTENVTNRARDLALRDWNENLLPGISDIFVRNGTYASSGMADKLLQGGRNVAEGLQDQYKSNLADAYDKSAGYFGSDATRSLQTAGTGGDLASLIQGIKMNDINSLMNAGTAQQQQTQQNYDLGYQDFVNQRDYPWTQIGQMTSALNGLPYGTSTNKSETGPLSGAEYGPSGLSSLLQGATAAKGIWDLFKGG